ncbi:MAG: FkbM family methyltransferase [Allorhizobium sp.]
MIAGKQQMMAATATPAGQAPAIAARLLDGGCDRTRAASLLTEICADRTVLAPVAPRQPLALYGAGNLGRLARDHLRSVGEDFAFVVDRNAEVLTNDPAWAGVRLMTPDDVPAELKQTALLAVSIATSPYVPLEAALKASGWRDVVPFYDLAESFRDRHPLSNGWFAAPFEADEETAMASLLERWDDDISRAHHLQFIAWRRLRQEWVFADAPVTLDDRFFIPEIMTRLGDDEIFVDAGAHHGSVTQRFLTEMKNRFASITAIEPDADSFVVLEKAIARLPHDIARKISLSEALLDSSAGSRSFHGGLGYASQIAKTGAAIRQTITIDALGLAPTFLKLHLEGAELAALEGAVATIQKHRPMIAATVYHNADGLFKTPAWLSDTLDDYHLAMRLHSWCGTGAVVYAIPHERLPQR